MKHKVAVALPAVVIAGLVGVAIPTGASAASGRTVYVDHSGTAHATAKGACGKPNYKTIQAAVNDPTTAVIIVCKGTYTEQVTVTRSLTLQGKSGATISAPAVLASGSIVRFDGVQKSRITGFTISGKNTTDPSISQGIDVLNGADVSIASNHVQDVRGLEFGATQGYGIVVSQAHADITGNTVQRYGNGGILVISSDAFATIENNQVHGQNTPDINNGQVGINIRESGQGNVEDNTVTGNSDGAGIVVDLTANVSIRDNSLSTNYQGIVVGDETGNITLRSNTIEHSTSDGIFLVDSSDDLVTENESAHNGGDGIRIDTDADDPSAFNSVISTNKIHDNTGDGISLSLGVTSNTLKENKISKSGGTDLVDANGTPLQNTYSDNHCTTSNPAGICVH